MRCDKEYANRVFINIHQTKFYIFVKNATFKFFIVKIIKNVL